MIMVRDFDRRILRNEDSGDAVPSETRSNEKKVGFLPQYFDLLS